MAFYYQVFGLYCQSEVEIPAFFPVASQGEPVDFSVKLGKVERKFSLPAQALDDYSQMNEQEFYFMVPEVAKYFVKDGQEITIEPLTSDMRDVLLYFQSNCMAALLFQRGKIPFHVSGVVDHDGGVWLFAAPSGTGKSTTALKLKERGYSLFTDDTALIYVENGKCYAQASYPMIKAWPTTLENQGIISEENLFLILKDWEKMGVYFHDKFINRPMEVKGITFIKTEGTEIKIDKIPAVEGMMELLANVYRGEWTTALAKNKQQFITVSEIAKTVNFCEAIRPSNTSTFDAFAAAIDLQIMQKKNNMACVEYLV